MSNSIPTLESAIKSDLVDIAGLVPAAAIKTANLDFSTLTADIANGDSLTIIDAADNAFIAALEHIPSPQSNCSPHLDKPAIEFAAYVSDAIQLTTEIVGILTPPPAHT
jgi:hypothetical protein